MRRADLISSGVLVALGLIAFLYWIPVYAPGAGDGEDLSPAFMPYVAAGLATAAMLWLFATRLLRAKVDAVAPAPLSRGSWLFVATATIVLAVTFVLLDRVGYVAGAACIVAGFMAMARVRWRTILGAAVVFPAALWLLFDKLLGFPLP